MLAPLVGAATAIAAVLAWRAIRSQSARYGWHYVPAPPGFKPAKPDPTLTPGDALPGVTVNDIRVPGYASKVRNVSEAEKRAVYARYGIATHRPGEYEVDHLISLELGGSNDIKNLWPQPAEPRPGFHEKDALENWLHDAVCRGDMDLATAQREIATDWYEAYVRYLGGVGRVESLEGRP